MLDIHPDDIKTLRRFKARLNTELQNMRSGRRIEDFSTRNVLIFFAHHLGGWSIQDLALSIG